MKTIFLRASLRISAVFLLHLPAGVMAAAPSLAASLPSGAAAFAELSGGRELVERLRGSRLLAAVLESDEYRQFEDSAQGQQLEAARATAAVMLGGSLWDAAAELTDGRQAIALYPPEASAAQPGAVALLRTTREDGLERVRKVLKPLLPAFAKPVDTAALCPGAETWTPKAGETVYLSFSGSWAVFTRERPLLDRTLRLLSGQADAAASLGGQKDYAARLRNTADHHVTVWASLESVRKFTGPRFGMPQRMDDGGASLILGGLLELASASPDAALTLDFQPQEVVADLSLSGDPAVLAAPASIWYASPPDSGVIPLPAVKGTIGGITVHRKFGQWYRDRDKLLTDRLLPAFDKFETDIGNLMPQKDFGEDVLPLLGDNFTLTAAHQTYSHLAGEPGIRLPAFALIFDITDPAKGADTFALFFQTLAAILNLQAGQEGRQPSVLDSEVHNGTKISYSRFLEKPTGDRLPVAWNFQPAAAAVGRKYIVATSLQYCRDLTDHFRNPSASAWQPRNTQFSLDVPSLAELAEKNEALLRSTEISKGRSPEDAARRITLLLTALRQMSAVRYESAARDGGFHMRLSAGWK